MQTVVLAPLSEFSLVQLFFVDDIYFVYPSLKMAFEFIHQFCLLLSEDV